ncbi:MULTISPECIES: DUF4367 domain-containing protein [Paenibacillus]|nr:DUF4367 domain-containing protein [Paenibacillus borealis]
MNNRKEDQRIFKEILQERSSDAAAKDKFYRILHEASMADAETMDTDLLKECVQTLDLLEEDTVPLSDEKAQAMQRNIENQYRTWKLAKHRTVVKKLIIRVSAVFLLFFCFSSIVANAFGLNFFKIVASWGEETFDFMAETNLRPTDNAANDQTYESIDKAFENVESRPLLPEWLPEGFHFKYAEKFERTTNTRIMLYYSSEQADDILIIDYLLYKQGYVVEGGTSFEKDETPVITFDQNGIKYYIFHNLEQTQVVWANTNLVININGRISVEEMKKMIESIPTNGGQD